jgi:hypothetical protein
VDFVSKESTMKRRVLAIVQAVWVALCVTATAVAVEAEKPSTVGSVSGKISPKGVEIRIIAKTAGTEHRNPKNVKGDVTLKDGGAFTMRNIPPGKYDLLFFLQGDSKKKYTATRWSEVVVKAGKTTGGINYRLTPINSPHLIDEVLVGFVGVSDAAARKVLAEAGCTVKDRPLKLGRTTTYTVDIPDDKSVAEMIELLSKKKGVRYAEPNGIMRAGI